MGEGPPASSQPYNHVCNHLLAEIFNNMSAWRAAHGFAVLSNSQKTLSNETHPVSRMNPVLIIPVMKWIPKKCDLSLTNRIKSWPWKSRSVKSLKASCQRPGCILLYMYNEGVQNNNIKEIFVHCTQINNCTFILLHKIQNVHSSLKVVALDGCHERCVPTCVALL